MLRLVKSMEESFMRFVGILLLDMKSEDHVLEGFPFLSLFN